MSAREDAAAVDADPGSAGPRRARPGVELLLVLGVSLGASGVYAVVQLADALSRGPLNQQSTTLNPTQSDRAVFDLIYQLLGIGFDLVPVALALYLLWAAAGASPFRRIGLDGRRPGFDAGAGVLLALAIGLPGIAFYLTAVHLGLDVKVAASGLAAHWYTIPVLVLSALRAALQEEVIVVGFLFDRLGALRWRPWAVLAASALLRGSYHLYQGFGGFLGNAVMGVVFGLAYRRFGRVAPLVVAHFLLDVASFVGYDLVKAVAPSLLP